MAQDLSPRSYLPGLGLCLAVATAALLLERAEIALAGKAWVEALVLAIALGAVIRTVWAPSPRFAPGVGLSARLLLEVAVALMGATVSLASLAGAGLPLLLGIVALVAVGVGGGYLLGRLFGLPVKMALLVACGNAICGNSAIAAVAPVIEAESEDVATAIAFTAVLGIGVVVGMPWLARGLHLPMVAGGALAGLTVYAVPQVLAAAGPLGPLAVQMGTLVKLVRVLMLGPVVTCLSLGQARKPAAGAHGVALVPLFIVAFLALAGLHTLGAVPAGLVAPAHAASAGLTVVAMAGLGLGVDLRAVLAAGPRVVGAVTVSLALLGGVALAVVHLAGLA